MTLCQKQLKKSFGQWLSVFVILLAGAFISGTSASAAGTVTSLTVNSSNYVTIPSYTGNAMLICFTPNDTYQTPATMTEDGNSMTLGYHSSLDAGGGDIFYYINPESGSKLLSNSYIQSMGLDNSFYNCSFVTGLASASPIASYGINAGLNSPASSTYSNGTNGNILLNFTHHGWESGTNTDSNFTLLQNNNLYPYGGNMAFRVFSSYTTIDNSNEQIDYSAYMGGTNSIFMELNTVQEPEGVSITSQSYNPVTGNVFLTGTCQQQGSGVNQMDLYAFETGTSTPNYSDRPYPERGGLVSCDNGSWTAVFNGKGLTGSNRIVIDDTFYGNTMASVVVNWQNVTGFIKFNYGDGNIINIDTTAQSGATTTLNFVYNICDDPDYSATSSKIRIGFQTGDRYQNDQISDTEYYENTECSGTGHIIFHLDHGQSGAIRAYYAYANSYNVIILKSGYFYINATYTEPIATSTAETLFGSNTHDLACSAEDWASSNENWIGFNGTKLKCIALQATYDTIAQINNFIIKIFQNLMSKVAANIFPFTIPIRLVECWNDSKITDLPSSLEWINLADANGNITLSFPKEWSGGTEDIKLYIWGPAVFAATPAEILFFSRIRNFLIYVFYGLFALAFYNFCQEFYDEHMAEKTREKHDINNYQL